MSDAWNTYPDPVCNALIRAIGTKMAKYAVGQVYERWTPFIVEDREIPDPDAECGFELMKIKSWRPGINHEPTAPDDFEPVWDGEGAEIRKIVAVVPIDGGGVRILYRRSWRRPDGKEFGKKTVRMTTPAGFTAWRNGSSSGWYRDLERRRDYAREMEDAA